MVVPVSPLNRFFRFFTQTCTHLGIEWQYHYTLQRTTDRYFWMLSPTLHRIKAPATSVHDPGVPSVDSFAPGVILCTVKAM